MREPGAKAGRRAIAALPAGLAVRLPQTYTGVSPKGDPQMLKIGAPARATGTNVKITWRAAPTGAMPEPARGAVSRMPALPCDRPACLTGHDRIGA